MVLAKKWIYVKRFDGFPKPGDIRLETEQIPDDIKEGEILCEAVYLTVDPYMRIAGFMSGEGSLMRGQQIARITISKHSDWPVGHFVLGYFGWRSHTVVDVEEGIKTLALWDVPYLERLTSCIGDLSPSHGLGTLGMTGATAYLGTLKVLQPKEGEVLLVNAAGGAVGSLVGQIAKIKGCIVIGCTGSQKKCEWLKQIGFDHVINYKSEDVNMKLKEAAPDGIHCYFDNVGGNFSNMVASKHMRRCGRIVCCGTISEYNVQTNSTRTDPVSSPWFSINNRRLKVEGINVLEWYSEYESAFKDISKWLKQGKIQPKEHITEGFENMEKAFMELFTGENIGKAIVKV